MINCIMGDVYHQAVHLSQQDLCEGNLGQSSQVHLEDFPKDWDDMFILFMFLINPHVLLILTLLTLCLVFQRCTLLGS